MNLKEKVRTLPEAPGVYLMKDSLGSIIYVGKSKNLKSRVGSYFQASKSHSPKVVKLVKNLKDFDYIITDTEFEAFLLECRLIKEIKPRYNRKMKSPLSYTYIKVNADDIYNGIETVNEKYNAEGFTYFGPYKNKNTVERAVQGIKESLKILCSNPSRNGTACLYYNLDACIGMCLGGDVKEQYASAVTKVMKLLSGTDNSILLTLEANMKEASEKFDFETAAKYRDYLSAVNMLLNSQKVIEFTEENKNIAMIEYLGSGSIKFFLIKGNKVVFSEKYSWEGSDCRELKSIMKRNILNYFNSSSLNTTINIGKHEIDEAQIIYSYLKNSDLRYVVIPKLLLEAENHLELERLIDSLLK